MSTKSDERLLEAFESVPAEDLIGRLQAVAEAAVRAEREGAEPVAFLIDWPDEPGLGHYFAEASCETGRSRPLYLHPPQASATVPEDAIDAVSKALRKAWHLGQTYWQQADHEFASHHRKADETQAKFDALVDETRALLAAPAPEQKCETCNGHGMIGGPSYYQPDEGGVNCPDCTPEQREKVELTDAEYRRGFTDGYNQRDAEVRGALV